MKIRSINSRNLSRLNNAFIDYLLDNGVGFHEIGLADAGEKLALIFKRDDEINVFKFSKETCIGYEPAAIAESIIKPMLNHLKGKED